MFTSIWFSDRHLCIFLVNYFMKELQTCRHLKRSVRLQTSSTEIITYALIGTSTATMDVHTLVRKRGLSGYIKHVIEIEGFSALFRGNGLNVLRVIPTR